MTVTCDVPPSIPAAIDTLLAQFAQQLSAVAAQRDAVLSAYDTLNTNVLVPGDELLARIMNYSTVDGVSTVDEYQETVGVATESDEIRLSKVGVQMVDGRGIVSSGSNVVALRELWRLVEQDKTAFDAILAKESGDFVIGVTYDETNEVSTPDGCGGVTITSSTTEVIVGIDDHLAITMPPVLKTSTSTCSGCTTHR